MNKTMGLVISHKNNEKRRAILPEDVKRLRHSGMLYFETGYGESVGYTDKDYLEAGAHVVSRGDALECDIITDVKLGDADYLDHVKNGKLLFGWAHAAQGISFTDKCMEKHFTVIAWEEIFEEGRYLFYRNREIAGEAPFYRLLRITEKCPMSAVWPSSATDRQQKAPCVSCTGWAQR